MTIACTTDRDWGSWVVYVVTRRTSGRRKKIVSYVEAVSNSSQRSGRSPDRQALILRLRSPRTEWVIDEKVIEQL